jgi:hypothetical protein
MGQMVGAPYFGNYDRLATPWRMAVGEVDGELVVVSLRQDQRGWTPQSFARLRVADGRIVHVADYAHCPWVLTAARSIELD